MVDAIGLETDFTLETNRKRVKKTTEETYGIFPIVRSCLSATPQRFSQVAASFQLACVFVSLRIQLFVLMEKYVCCFCRNNEITVCFFFFVIIRWLFATPRLSLPGDSEISCNNSPFL